MSSASGASTAIVAVSRPGAALARRLAAGRPDAELHLERRAAADDPAGVHCYDLPLRPVLQELFRTRDALVVFLPVGATVRLLAPALGDKKRDPAVVCVDDAGRYAVSVLSGHAGGADELAVAVAALLGAQPVITSASTALNVTPVDLVGKSQGWRIEATPADLTRAAAAVVNGAPVALWLDPETPAAWPADTPLSAGIRPVDSLAEAASAGYAARLIVSDRILPPDAGPPRVIYRPATLVVGIGCRRNVPLPRLAELLDDTLTQNGLAKDSVARVATADLKADEPGIIALAEELAAPLVAYPAERLNEVGRRYGAATATAAAGGAPTPSAARGLLGIFGVSEPAAMLAAGADGVIVPRTKSDCATVAVARIAGPPASPDGPGDAGG